MSEGKSNQGRTFEDLSAFKNCEILRLTDSNGLYIKAEAELDGVLQPALIVVSKTSLYLKEQDESKELINEIFSKEMKIISLEHNDIYYSCTARASGTSKKHVITLQIEFPCLDKQRVEMLSKEPNYIHVRETMEIYEKATLKWFEATPSKKLNWVYNILENKSSEVPIFNDPDEQTGFVLLPDFKWDKQSLNQLYCLAIVNRRDIRSVRDLTDAHLPLLHKLKKKPSEVIKEKFGVKSLRIFVHYIPSFLHFHVHYVTATYVPPGLCVPRAILLDDIIDNITINPKHYQERALSIFIESNDPSFSYYQPHLSTDE